MIVYIENLSDLYWINRIIKENNLKVKWSDGQKLLNFIPRDFPFILSIEERINMRTNELYGSVVYQLFENYNEAVREYKEVAMVYDVMFERALIDKYGEKYAKQYVYIEEE